jgi:hypothetical protein
MPYFYSMICSSLLKAMIHLCTQVSNTLHIRILTELENMYEESQLLPHHVECPNSKGSHTRQAAGAEKL